MRKLIPLLLITFLISCTEKKLALSITNDTIKNVINAMKHNNIQVAESRKQLRNSGFRYKLALGTDSKDFGQLGKMYQSASWEFDSTGNLNLISISLFKSSSESQKLFNLLFNTLTNSQYDWSSDYQVLASNTVQNEQIPFESLNDVSKNISYMAEDDVLTVIIR